MSIKKAYYVRHLFLTKNKKEASLTAKVPNKIVADSSKCSVKIRSTHFLIKLHKSILWLLLIIKKPRVNTTNIDFSYLYYCLLHIVEFLGTKHFIQLFLKSPLQHFFACDFCPILYICDMYKMQYLTLLYW